jgi:hypothetical protein
MTSASEQRALGRRISYGIVWAIIFYVLTNFIIGGIVGFIAGTGTTTFEAGALAGQRASSEFFNQNRWIVLGVQISIFAILCFYGVLPGVGKVRTREAIVSDGPPPPEVYGLASEQADSMDEEGR